VLRWRLERAARLRNHPADVACQKSTHRQLFPSSFIWTTLGLADGFPYRLRREMVRRARAADYFVDRNGGSIVGVGSDAGARGGTRKNVRAEGLEPSRAFAQRIFVPSTAFAAPPFALASTSAGLRSGLSLHRAQDLLSGVRCCPSSLYTFPAGMLRPGLARDCHVKGFPEFGQFCIAGFPASTQVLPQVPFA